MDQLLLQTGDKLLLQSGDYLLLESSVIDPDSDSDRLSHRQPDRFPHGLSLDRMRMLRGNLMENE